MNLPSAMQTVMPNMLNRETRLVNPILSADIIETGNDYKITVSLPGVHESDLDVELCERDRTITIKGHTEQTFNEDGDTYHRRERHCGDVKRTIPIPSGACLKDVNTSLCNGILTVTFPKQETVNSSRRLLPIKTDVAEKRTPTHQKITNKKN